MTLCGLAKLAKTLKLFDIVLLLKQIAFQAGIFSAVPMSFAANVNLSCKSRGLS